MSGDVYTRNNLGTIGGSLGVFETAFRIFISVCVISESAADSAYLISRTEVNKLNWTQKLPEVELNRIIFTYKSVESGEGHCGIHHFVILFYTH